jgi:YnbE-like lipoprotein
VTDFAKIPPGISLGLYRPIAAGGLALLLGACNPTVKIEAPDKPIVINLNIKIEQDVRVRVDKDVEQLMRANPNLF